MRIGLIARADWTGIASQTWAFWRNMEPTRTLVVDLERFGFPILSRDFPGPATVWQAGDYLVSNNARDAVVEEFLENVDLVFCVETPYNYWLYERAAELGKPTVCQVNPEFCDHLVNSDYPRPTVFALPTRWMSNHILDRLPGQKIVDLPVPVDTQMFPYRKRTELTTLLHVAGTMAQPDRNGTNIVLEAMRLVRTPVKARITSVYPFPAFIRDQVTSNVQIDDRPVNSNLEVFGEEDILVMPRRFGGLCLPQQEALCLGMGLLMSEVSPQKALLPGRMLVDVTGGETIQTRVPIQLANVDPLTLAVRLDYLYANPHEIEEMSEWAGMWRELSSWDKWRPKYLELFESL